MKDNIDNIGDYLGQCMDMFFWDYVSYKNTLVFTRYKNI